MPSCWSKMSALPLAAVILVSLTAPGSASINLAGALMVPTTIAPRYCSGAFRYAARVGNSEISPLSAVQAFANDRRVARSQGVFPDADQENRLDGRSPHSGFGKNEPDRLHRLPRRSRPEAVADDQSQVVRGDLDQVALLHILHAAQPGPAQAADVQDHGEAAFHLLRPQLERLPGDRTEQPGAVVVDRAAGGVIAVPAGEPPVRSVSAIRLFQTLSSRSFRTSREW